MTYRCKIFLIYAFCLFLMNSCVGVRKMKETGGMQMYAVEDNRTINDGGILFVSLNMFTDAAIEKANIVEAKIVEGTLKRDEFDTSKLMKEGFILLSFLDDTQQTIKTKTIQNPLSYKLEGPGENEKSMEWNKIEKQQTEFFIRTLYSSNLRYLKIEKIGMNEHLTNIALIKLNL